MSEDTLTTGDVQSNVEPQAQPGPTVTPTAVDAFEARFKGLQRTMQQMLQATGWNQLEAIPPRADVETWRTKTARVDTLEEQLATLQANLVTRDTEIGALQQTQAALQAERDKLLLLAQTAPNLLPMAEDIKTGATLEEQQVIIQAFAAKLAKVAGPTLPGVQPLITQPPAGGLADVDRQINDVLNRMQAATERGDYNAANELRAEYFRLQVEQSRTNPRANREWAPNSGREFGT